MAATVHDLTSRLAPAVEQPAGPALTPDPSWTEAEARIWWLGHAAGYTERDLYYEEREERLMNAFQKFLDSQSGSPRLEVVS